MPRQLAAIVFVAFIVWLLARDVKANPTVSRAVWIPWIWFTITASKSLTRWLYGIPTAEAGPNAAAASIDRYLIMLLIALGLFVVISRSFSWSSFIAKNRALAFYLFYSLASIIWSDVPKTVFTQWHHMFLQFLMILVIYTEQEPAKALYALFRRCAYVLFPVSVLYIKYYPELGRRFDFWTGAAVDVGITDDKNKLGAICWVMGLFFLSLLFAGPKRKRLVSGTDRYIALAFLATIVWLLVKSETSTALVSLIISSAVIVCLQNSTIRRHFTAFLLLGCFLAAVLLTFTNVKETIILGLGEDLTLTGRTELWADLQNFSVNPIVGTGFESFWTGERIESLWRKYWWHPNQAHNGYLEMYLNLGILGLLALCAMVFSCYVKTRRQMLAAGPDGERTATEDDGMAQFRLAFLMAYLAANWTSASFRSVDFLFLVYVAVAVEYVPLPRRMVGHVSTNRLKVPRVLQASS